MFRRFLLLVMLVVTFAEYSSSQVVVVIDSLPVNTPESDTIFLASSLNCWDTHDSTYFFTRGKGGQLELLLPAEVDSFEFKLCRGSWLSVEMKSNGTDIPNRFLAKGTNDTILLKVQAWRDLIPKKQIASTATKGVRYLPTIFEIPQLKRKRTIRLYLPPNYSSGELFPVIYMHDGQNLFDNSTAFAGEWKVDEIMDSLYTYRGFSAIVVAVYNDDKERINEYSPWKNDSLGIEGDGDKYAKFIANTLKPFIDRHYRTLSGRENTAIIGSSMGGLISLYIALEYPDLFGNAAIFSPSIGVAPKLNDYLQKYKHKKFQHIYFLAGEKEGGTLVDDVNRAVEQLKAIGFDDEHELKVTIAPDGRHAEWFWSREFGDAVRYMFNF
ncbi:MAG: alpha/beta hydrolase [Bacteroidales bacterium]